VSKIKELVEEKEGIPPAQQRLIYGGKQMYAALLPFLPTPSHLSAFPLSLLPATLSPTLPSPCLSHVLSSPPDLLPIANNQQGDTCVY